MATTKLYLDTRTHNETAPLKLMISHKGKTALISLGISIAPNQWDKKAGKVINHPKKSFYNSFLQRKKIEADEAILMYAQTRTAQTTAAELKDIILAYGKEPDSEKPKFKEYMERFVAMKSEGTGRLYMETHSRLSKYVDNFDKLTFEDITREWLVKFEMAMEEEGIKKNTRNIHLRNIRAIFNFALDEDAISVYPFRRFKIKPEPTKKRSLTVEQLRFLFNYDGVEEYAVEYVDMFKLIFFLVGINITDLCHLKAITNDGRIEYKRAKTHRPYSIKVEPEAMIIIAKYRGKDWLVSPLDHCKTSQTYVQHMNAALQNIGEVKYIGQGRRKERKPIFPELTTYWARHTWATIAAELDIPKETIAHALGHGGHTVTDIYIDFDMRKVDDANRRVIDYVLYDKR